ncbi:MAG: helix-turn-helix transcriptional regulator [Pseudolysinimonas sp.]
MAHWTFLTNHAHVLLCVAEEPDARVRDIAETVGVTERAAQRILTELEEAGYLTRTKDGRRNRYTLNPDVRMRHPMDQEHHIGELVNLLAKRAES